MGVPAVNPGATSSRNTGTLLTDAPGPADGYVAVPRTTDTPAVDDVRVALMPVTVPDANGLVSGRVTPRRSPGSMLPSPWLSVVVGVPMIRALRAAPLNRLTT